MFCRFITKPVGEENFWYFLYSPCAEFNEFVGQNQSGYVPCVNASVSIHVVLRKIILNNLQAHKITYMHICRVFRISRCPIQV